MVTSNNIILAGIITISLTVIGALLSDVFSPLSEFLKDQISTVPRVNYISAKVFDNENKEVSREIVNGSKNISTNAVTFDFKPAKVEDTYFFLNLPYSLSFLFNSLSKMDQFECSFDGYPFEDCSPPKPYYDLKTEAIHVFKVKNKGILGNTQDVPTTFNFTSVTSSIFKGIVEKNEKPVENATVEIVNSKKIDKTDSAGYFSV